jgi:hypothetical protein
MIPMMWRLHPDMALIFFDIQEYAQAKAEALRTGGVVYTWKTSGRSNWLERGVQLADRLGFFVLPDALPSTIEMDDDE